MNTGKEWALKVLDGMSYRAAAQKLKMAQNTLNRQISENKMTPEVVVRIARTFGADPVEGLIAIGLITEEEGKKYAPLGALRETSTKQLLEEIASRVSRD